MTGYKRKSHTRLARAGRVAYGLASLARRRSGFRPKGKKRTGGVKDILQRKHTSQRIPQSTGGSMSRYVHKAPCSRFTKAMFKRASSNYYVTNASFRLTTGGTGVQAVTSYSLLTGGVVGGTGDLPYIYNKVTGTNTGYKTTRVFFESVSAKYMMTNQDLTNANVTLYDVICRRDTNNSPDYEWSAGITEENATYNAAVVGCTPFSSSLLCSHYKVLKTSKLVLSPGQTHTHSVYYRLNRLLNQDILYDSLTELRGITIATIVVTHGEPTNSAATATNVTTASSTLDIVQTKQIRYSWIADDDTNFFYVNNLPAVADPHIVNVGNSAISSDAVA